MLPISSFYYGGSGGFLLLHSLLLTDQFYADGYDEKTLNDLSIWKISNNLNWKNHEIWPNNLKTSEYQTNKIKLYHHCNDDINWQLHQGTRVLLYTDLETQLALAKYKNAWIYNPTANLDTNKLEFELRKNAVDINGEKCFYRLADTIKNADIVIYLQDFITTPDHELSKLDLKLNKKIQELIDHWISLHSDNIISYLLR